MSSANEGDTHDPVTNFSVIKAYRCSVQCRCKLRGPFAVKLYCLRFCFENPELNSILQSCNLCPQVMTIQTNWLVAGHRLSSPHFYVLFAFGGPHFGSLFVLFI